MGLFGGWFEGSRLALVEPDGDRALVATRGDGSRLAIDVAGLSWIGFLFVGDEFSPVHEGWWLFGSADGAVAIWIDCPRVDPLMRRAPLATVADALPARRRIDVASRPIALRGRSSRDGIVRLDAAAVARLLAQGVVQEVAGVADFPAII